MWVCPRPGWDYITVHTVAVATLESPVTTRTSYVCKLKIMSLCPIPHPNSTQDKHVIHVSYPTWHYPHTPPALFTRQTYDTSKTNYATKSPIPNPLVYKTGVWYTLVTLRDKIPHTPPTCVQDRRVIQVSYPTWHNPPYPTHLCTRHACDTS